MNDVNITIDDIKKCKSFKDAVLLICEKNYTNARTNQEVIDYCNSIGFDFVKHLEEINKHYCLFCGALLDKNKKFCNNSCAAKYNNRGRKYSDETKNKISKSIKRFRSSNKQLKSFIKGNEGSLINNKNSIIKENKICVVCGKEFYSKHKNVTHCSKKCVGNDLSIKQNLRNKQLKLIEEGKHAGWQSRNIISYPEKFWMSVLDNNGISYIREDFSTKKYFLDFLIEKNGQKIDLEIDGKQHKYRVEHDITRDKYLTDLGYIVYRVEWNCINNDKGKEMMKEKIDNFLSFYENI